MFYDFMNWFRDWDGDLSFVWEWFVDLFMFYWSEHPIYTLLAAFTIAVMILISSPKTRYFGNQLLSIGVNVALTISGTITQTIIKDGGKWLLSIFASTFHRLTRIFTEK